MGILNSKKPDMTREEKLATYMDVVADLEEDTMGRVRANRQKGHDIFWDNKDFTPQEMFNAYGNEAWDVIVQDESTTDYVNTNCPEGDSRLGPLRIITGVPDTYVLIPVADRTPTEANPYGFGSVVVKPKLYVLAPAGAVVVIGDQTVTVGADADRATFVLPEGSYSGQATLDGYQGGAFTINFTRGGQTVQSGLTLIPPPPEEEPPTDGGGNGGGE